MGHTAVPEPATGWAEALHRLPTTQRYPPDPQDLLPNLATLIIAW